MSKVFYFFKNLIRNALLQVYWIYNYFNIKVGKDFQFSFPLIIEGRGRIIFGNNIKIGRKVNLGCSQGSSFNFGSDIRIGSYIKIISSGSQKVHFSDGLSIGDYTVCYIQNHWEIGVNVKIATYCQIFSRETGFAGCFTVGSNSNIGDFTLIDLSGNVSVGSNVAIGPRCTIYTHDHNYRESKLIAPWKGTPKISNVHIEDGAWIGANVSILPGVRIGKHSIIAAGSVVTKDVPQDCIYGGVPARLLKTKE